MKGKQPLFDRQKKVRGFRFSVYKISVPSYLAATYANHLLEPSNRGKQNLDILPPF